MKLFLVIVSLIMAGVASAQTAPTFVTQPPSVTVSDGGVLSVNVIVSTSMTTSKMDLGFGVVVDVPTPAGVTFKAQFGNRTLDSISVATATVNTRITASVSFGPISIADVGSFRLLAANQFGTTPSESRTLTVTASAPSITTQPSGQTVKVNDTLSLIVTASGTAPLSYQWRKDGVTITGATSSVLTLTNARASDSGSYAVSVSNSIGSVASNSVEVSVNSIPPPIIVTHPESHTVNIGANTSFTVSATGTGPLLYQWRKEGAVVTGATNSSFLISNVGTHSRGSYTVTVNNAGGSVTSQPAALSVTETDNTGRLSNLSIRTTTGAGDSTLIVGLGIGGRNAAGAKPILIRAVGPTLEAFGVGGALADPTLAVFRGDARIAENDDWAGSFDLSSVGAFALSGPLPKDAALHDPAMGTGSYTIQITGKGGGTGIALAEIYDATPSASFTAVTPRLVNVSARTHVGTGENILIAGINVGGTTPIRVIIRGVGPTLESFGVSGALADPKLEVYSGVLKIAENDNWIGNTEVQRAIEAVGAFSLISASRDAALLTTLQPGSYTVQLVGVGGASGVALVEVYQVP